MNRPVSMNETARQGGYPMAAWEGNPGIDPAADAEEMDFNYEGYQVVRGEFFSHLYEPSFSFNNEKVYVNAACIRKIPNYDYVQILVNPEEKKLAVRPCTEDERDSFRWCSSSVKRSPKQITCRMFFAKVMTLMGWNAGYRYKLLGKLVRSNGQLLYVFDLNSPEIYIRQVHENGAVKNVRTPAFPEEWKNQFGLSYTEHQKMLQVETFDGYTVFGLQPDPKKTRGKKKDEKRRYEQLSLQACQAVPADRPEEGTHPDP